MQQYIYHGSSFANRDERIRSDFDFNAFIVTELGTDEVSIKIESVRSLIGDLSIISEKPRLIYLRDASLLTLPSQNALLKTLEEPPPNLVFILSVDNLTSLLPTIRSRARTVNVRSRGIVKNQESLATVKSAIKLKMGERIQFADSLGKDREICITWLDSLINSLYQVMQETNKGSGLQMLANLSKLAITTRTDLSTNINVNLSMQHFFLSLPQLKSL